MDAYKMLDEAWREAGKYMPAHGQIVMTQQDVVDLAEAMALYGVAGAMEEMRAGNRHVCSPD